MQSFFDPQNDSVFEGLEKVVAVLDLVHSFLFEIVDHPDTWELNRQACKGVAHVTLEVQCAAREMIGVLRKEISEEVD